MIRRASGKVVVAACLALSGVLAERAQAGATVDWSADYENILYMEDGTPIQTGDLLVQVVVDISGNTDFASLVAARQLDVGMDTGFGGAHSTATDDLVFDALPAAGGVWEYDAGFMDYSGSGTYDVGENFTKTYYFRWFNAIDIESATEVGFIYSSGSAWQTPADVSSFVPTRDLTYATRAGNNVGGTQIDGSGWSTVAAVPEPGFLGLMAVGLATLIARRKRTA